MALSPQQSDGSSDEGSLHIDTDSKPARSAKGKKEGVGSAAGILDLLQASEEVGALEYNPSRYAGARPGQSQAPRAGRTQQRVPAGQGAEWGLVPPAPRVGRAPGRPDGTRGGGWGAV